MIEVFSKVSCDLECIYGGSNCTGGAVTLIGNEDSWGVGSIQMHRSIFKVHDGDTINADGQISFTNLRTEYGSWHW